MIRQKGQLYWNDEKVNLSDDVLSIMLSDKSETMHKKAADFLSSLGRYIDFEILRNFKWLKSLYQIPFFMDCCFMYKSTVYGIILASMRDDGMLEKTPFIEMQIEMCRKYDIIPVILPFDRNGEVIVTNRSLFSLIYAEKYYNEGIIEDVDVKAASSNAFKECSKWELLNTSVSALAISLKQRGVTEILYHTYPEVYPQICYIDEDKAFNWVAVDIVKERDERPIRDDNLLSVIHSKGGKGVYVLSELSNPYAPNVFPRGEKFDIRCEVTQV